MQKISTKEQVGDLKVGGTITRYPPYSNMQQVFDPKKTQDISEFQIRTINTLTGMMALVSTDNASATLSGSPVSVGRLSIKATELTDGYWWI